MNKIYLEIAEKIPQEHFEGNSTRINNPICSVCCINKTVNVLYEGCTATKP
jgi:hypothetical protein